MAVQPPAITATAASILWTGSDSKRLMRRTTLYSPKIVLNVVNEEIFGVRIDRAVALNDE